MLTLVIASLFSGMIGLLIVTTKSYHQNLTADSNQGVQKFHAEITPRIGGIALVLGLFAGLVYEIYLGKLTPVLPIGLAISAFPIFFMGMLEDFTKKVHATPRFVMSIVSGISFYAFLNVGITQTGLYWLDDNLLSVPFISLLLTTIMIAGVSNATNIIDGFNGLLLSFALMAAAAIIWVSYTVGDQQILSMSVILTGAIFGLIIFNFPKGTIFTGDGGAYLLGFLLAALSILLVNRNEEVSPWFPMLLLLYPITEILFSMFRRVLVDNTSPFDPDNKHLHTLIYRSILLKEEGYLTYHLSRYLKQLNKNAQTTVLIWPLMLCSIIPSLLFWQDTMTLMIANGLFLLGYYRLYKRLSHYSESFSYN